MKFTPEVIAALQVLRDNAENDFERHRLDVLERDLTAPPQFEQVDENHQQFNGIIFYKHTSGHYTTNLPIHRAVWQYYIGDIPAGYDIHHVDHNKANNVIENFQCLTPSEHKSLHNLEMKSREFVCEICGKKFFSSRIDTQNVRYCSKRCNARAFKQNHMETRTCIYCGKEFTAPAVNNTQFCSQSCANNALWNSEWKNRRAEQKKCPVCEQEFTPRTKKQIYCSKYCRNIAFVRRNKKRNAEKREQKQRTCPACGKKFIASRKEQVCCSQSCAAKFQHSKRPKLEEKICPVCGKTFMPQKSKQIYCSTVCSTKARTGRKPIERKLRVCSVCGKEFTPKYPSSKAVCCSHECAMKLVAQRKKNRNEEKQKVCPVCGKSFMPKKGQIYCSRVCAGKNYSQTRRKSDAEKQRICPVCGKSFIPSHSSVICCSRACGAKITAQKIKQSPIEKTCPVCGKTFTVRQSSSKRIYCSRSCAMVVVNQKTIKRNKERRLKQQTCPVCGESFTPKKTKQVYCSHSCAVKMRCQKKKAEQNISISLFETT